MDHVVEGVVRIGLTVLFVGISLHRSYTPMLLLSSEKFLVDKSF